MARSIDNKSFHPQILQILIQTMETAANVEHKMEVKKVPKLRFSEFDGEWKEKQLGKLCSTFKSGVSITSERISDNGQYPVFGGNGLRGYTDSFTHDGFHVLIGRQGALCGNIKRARGKSYISEHAIAVQANETSDTELLAQKLDYLKLNRLSESSAQPGLAVNRLVKLKIIVPSLPEQQKIAAFLSAVDKKIQQLTRKKELLEQYKKGVMQKIFSQEIRFKDENGNDYPDWEERRIKDVGKVITGNTPPTSNAEFYVGERLFVSPADIQENRYITSTKTTLTDMGFRKGRFIKKGSVLFVCIGSTIGKVGQAGIDCITNQQINSIVTNSTHDDCFIFSLLEFKSSSIKLLAGKQAVPLLNKSDFERINITVPSLPEQQKIADFLSNIDYKIESMITHIEQTQQFKNGLLQQMFV